VDFPPHFVHQLGQPSSYFWLGPLAVFVAGLLALGGAIIAFCVAKRTIKANAKNVQDQIGANNKAVQDQIAANAKAVQDQIAANANAVQDQIAAAATQQQKNRDAEWARLRRQEVLDLLAEAGTMARKLLEIAVTYSRVTDPERSQSPDDERLRDLKATEFRQLNSPDRLPIVLDKLKMHGLTAVSSSLSDLN